MCGVQSTSTGSSTSSSARAAAANASTSKKLSAKKAAKSAKKAAKQQGKLCSSAAQPWLGIAQDWACALFECALNCTEMQSDLLDCWKILDWLEVWTEGLPTDQSTALR